ncbi:hypothetical protein OG912_00035 [Streptomyces sp. NBC_00464]
MSAETFWGGVEGNREVRRPDHGITGLGVATGARPASARCTCTAPAASVW